MKISRLSSGKLAMERWEDYATTQGKLQIVNVAC